MTGDIVAITLRHGKLGINGPILRRIKGHAKASASGTVTLTQATADLVTSGEVYVNVGTSKAPTGEIRGQVKCV